VHRKKILFADVVVQCMALFNVLEKSMCWSYAMNSALLSFVGSF
jgi:hypothetical protein